MSIIRTTIFLATLHLLAITANAQFNAILYSMYPLTDFCIDGNPLPEGTFVGIYWDNDANGPDLDDPQPTVGECYACCNFNGVQLNGEEMLGVPGGFFTDPAFTIVTVTPQPSLYYLRYVMNAMRWTSSVFTIENGLNEYDLTEGWTCELVHQEPCDDYLSIGLEDMTQDPNNRHRFTHTICVDFCANMPVYLHNFDLPLAGGGIATLTPGCGSESSCNLDDGLTYAYPLWENGTNTVHLWEYNWDAWIPMVSPVSGWGCLYIDIILPVAQGTFGAVAGDGRVILNWNTLSETNVERFDIFRQGSLTPAFEPIASIPAENSPSGANYTFVDHNVKNDETYTYKLVTVNLDGSREEWGVGVTATPHAEVVIEYALHQNYPNPFNPITIIAFDVLEENPVTLKVFNTNGQLVSTPVNGTCSAGRHTISFDANGLSAGVYFYTVSIGGSFKDTKKMLLLK